jgi:hypothetical protein
MPEETMIECAKCRNPLGEGEKNGPTAAISGSIMGDEHTESWYFCPDCQLYTFEDYRDRFSDEDTVNVRDPIDKATGDAKVAIIRQCPKPSSKRCRCPAHLEYFGNWLD